MIRLDVLSDGTTMGWLTYDESSNLFAFDYAPEWLSDPGRSVLSPLVPFVDHERNKEKHSLAVRQFFENLLPEGRALDEAASANNVSKANLIGLILVLGKETTGALSIWMENVSLVETLVKRHLSKAELSERIRARPYEPFSVWDNKVRLSIAGHQSKLAVFKEDDEWFLVEGPSIASTVILKPEPIERKLAGLTSNEFFCMRLAKNIGLAVAEVRLIHVPEPVLEVQRFDRTREGTRVRRLPVIDACQALGLSVALKYERPYGDGKDVQHIRDGASFPQLFRFLNQSQNPVAERLLMLRWVLFQILIGNTDAHAKNISFFSSHSGFTATPAYDLVSSLSYPNANLSSSFAMAIGDAFVEADLSAYEWAHFAYSCGLAPRLVATEMKKLITKIQIALPATMHEVISEHAETAIVKNVHDVVLRLCEKHLTFLSDITKVERSLFM